MLDLLCQSTFMLKMGLKIDNNFSQTNAEKKDEKARSKPN